MKKSKLLLDLLKQERARVAMLERKLEGIQNTANSRHEKIKHMGRQIHQLQLKLDEARKSYFFSNPHLTPASFTEPPFRVECKNETPEITVTNDRIEMQSNGVGL